MSQYPARYETDIRLRDGSSLRLRPIKPDDAAQLIQLHRRLSSKSVYFRFFAPLPELSPQRAAALATVDYRDAFALVAEANGQIVAVARYYRNRETPERAEVAFVTEDALQRRGIASRMLDSLAEIARDHGINSFEAYVLGDNRSMMSVFLRSGYKIERALDGGVIHVTFPITPAASCEPPCSQDSSE